MAEEDSLYVRRLRNRTLPIPRDSEKPRTQRSEQKKMENDSVSGDESDDDSKGTVDDSNESVIDTDNSNDDDGSRGCYPDLSGELDSLDQSVVLECLEPKRVRKPVDSNEKSEPPKSPNRLFSIILFVIVAIILGGIWHFKDSDPTEEKLSRWEKSFSEIVGKYGSAIPKVSQKVIDRSVRNVLKRRTSSKKFDKCEPAVILIVGSKYNAPAVKCVFSGLSQSIAEIFEEDKAPILQAENLSKLDITNQFNDILGHKALHSIILDGIERLDGRDALSLHHIADHDKAPYQDVIILLTAYTDARLTNTSLQVQQIDNIANSLLEYSWGDMLPEEQVAGLLSRLTPSVAIISDTNESQKWLCE